MSELKTLEDLQRKGIFPPDQLSFIECYNDALEDLKQEAIKEIKTIRKTQEDDFILSDYGRLDKHSVISYIKWKNNITEEDLQ